MLTTKQVAARMKISREMVRKYVQRGRLVVKKREGRENFFAEKDVKKLEKTRKPAHRPRKSKKA